jgi:uncharacterized protein (TIGR02453 family)
MTFAGFPPEALTFYEGLESDNSKTYWQANKATYHSAIKEPMEALLAQFEPLTGPFHTFRPNRDVRFSKDKLPYKTHTGSVAEGEGGTMYYVELSAKGLRTGCGYYGMDRDQLERFRTAVLDDHRGAELAAVCDRLAKKGITFGAMSEVKTAPHGIPKDHPRIEILRRKGLIGLAGWDPEPWLHTVEVTKRIRAAWKTMAPLSVWLDLHVGPSLLPPDESRTWR